MELLPSGKVAACTAKHEGRVAVLRTNVNIAPPFDYETETPPEVPGDYCVAIWDTGATNTVIAATVAERLSLPQIGLIKCQTVNGERDSAVYLVSLFLPNRLCLPAVRVCEGDIFGADVLIGMDVIGSGDFAVTHYEGNTVMSFRIPSKKCIDFVVEEYAGTPRNDPCPCGSGKKYKQCCLQ